MLNIKKTALVVSLALPLSSMTAQVSAAEKSIDQIASNLSFNYQVITNIGASDGLPCQDLGAEWASCNRVNLTIKNSGEAIKSDGWSLYFHSIRRILDVDSDLFTVSHITGDLHKLSPTEKFTGFRKGESLVLPLIGEYWTLFETDFMPGVFVADQQEQTRALKSMDTEQVSRFVTPISGDLFKRTPDDNNVLATPESRFEKNSDIKWQPVSGEIIPTPVKVTVNKGSVSIASGLAIESLKLPAEVKDAVLKRAELLDINASGKMPVKLTRERSGFSGKLARSGAYNLSISDSGIYITGYDDAGMFYGLQSLFALSDSEGKSLPKIEIQDAPRFDYRGVMVDVARNFHTKQAILDTLDQMAAYKLNKLHLHLSDDEGWRLEIPGLPELTDVGAKRCFDPEETSCLLPQLGSGPGSDNNGTGYFSRNDYIEILRYAKARSIEVIPELDMPAHARAAVVSMEARYKKLMAQGKTEAASQYRLMDPQDRSNVTTIQFYDKRSFINPCMESSSAFVTKVVDEVSKMYQEAGLPLTSWHFGGDEAKNIKVNAGFQDNNVKEPVAWRGNIDLSKQNKPFELSPMCQLLIDSGKVADYDYLPSYFAEQVSKIAADKGIANFQAWEDGLKYSENADSFASKNTMVNFWETLYWGGAKSAYEWADKGYNMIISNPDYVYMDMPYEVGPKERGYYWATRATDSRKMFSFSPENLPQNAETSLDRDGNSFTAKGETKATPFYGMSAQLWSETVRTDEQYEYMVFPRVLAAAERAWHKADWELEYQVNREFNQKTTFVDKALLKNDWQRFANTVGQREMKRLEKAGIDFRLPLPGAKVINGLLNMNISFPGLKLQYSLDKGESWLEYNADQKPRVTGKVWLRSVSPSGKNFSRVSVM